MPCAGPSELEILAIEKEDNKNLYGMKVSNEELFKHIACNALTILEEHNLLGDLDKMVNRWWVYHKAEDEVRRLALLEEEEENKLRKKALDKLTEDEKRSLGF